MYFKSRKHIKPLWFSNISTFLMFWTYIKAFWSTQRAKIQFRIFCLRINGKALSFKTTLKVICSSIHQKQSCVACTSAK